MSIVDVLAPAARNGRFSVPASVVKRDGSRVEYSCDKILNAVVRCFANDCGVDLEQARALGQPVVWQVQRLLYGSEEVHVEKIQDLVEQQLMALGHHDAARKYILYRESRRVARETEKVVAPELRGLFAESSRYFNGTNKHLQQVQAFDKFARFDWSKGRREVWPESVNRVMAFTQKHVAAIAPAALSETEWAELRLGLLNMEASPSMRLVQMAGPSLERCQSGVFNCAFQFMDGPQALAEELYMLMQGCGVGFSVEHQYAVDKWPRVKRQRGGLPDKYVISDTTEGWCDAIKHGVERWLEGGDYNFDDSQIRPAGSILRTKGGRSSGPQPLRDLITFARGKIFERQGDRLTSLDIHDITCLAHRIVQMGGVRRASGISFSDLDDTLMRGAKDGTFWKVHPYRNQANNSAVYETKPSALAFMEEWLALGKSGSGERGIFNAGGLKRQLPRRRKRVIMRCNPCGEVNLRSKSCCNLSISVLRPKLTVDEVRRRVRLATKWGTIQSTMTRFNYLCDTWRQNIEEERLLGVDLLGHPDWAPLQPGASGREELLQSLLKETSDENIRLAARLGINPSVALTCGKPAGDSACFFDTIAGFKAHHGAFYIRRIRLAAHNPVSLVLKEAGVPWCEDYDKSGLLVFEFPCQAPAGGLLMGEQSAIEQLENWKCFKIHWTEHNPSVTIYVKPEEWLEVGHWVYANWDNVGGLSFLPYDGGIYPLAPYEAISETEYRQRADAFPEIDWARLTLFESEDMTTLAQQVACVGGACAI